MLKIVSGIIWAMKHWKKLLIRTSYCRIVKIRVFGICHTQAISLWHLIRKRGFITKLSQNCWHKQLPLMISHFLWKLLHNAIPIDQEASKKGICLPSKCLCCFSSNNLIQQSSLPLFETASYVWVFFFKFDGQ